MSDVSFASLQNWKVFTPTVTLVGGAGNIVPVYVTNTGYYYQFGNLVFIQLYLAGDGGAEGAGTGQINIALPITSSANQLTDYTLMGRVVNGTAFNPLMVQVASSSSTATLGYMSTATTFVTLSGNQQNNTTREISGIFSYQV